MYRSITKYTTLGMNSLVDAIEKNSIGSDDWVNRSSLNYPPYNLIKENATEFVLEIALAGYNKDDIEVSTESNKLIVKCVRSSTEPLYMHNEIIRREFTRTWSLSDDVVVNNVLFVDGLLTVKLNKVIPEHHQKKVWF